MIAVAQAAQDALEDRNLPIQVAVMGCVVNGPGEAREADLGIAAGRKRGHLFIKGKIVRVVPEDEMVEALVAEAERLVAEGVEARLAAADGSPRPRPRPTAARCSRPRGRTPTPRRPRSSSSASASAEETPTGASASPTRDGSTTRPS